MSMFVKTSSSSASPIIPPLRNQLFYNSSPAVVSSVQGSNAWRNVLASRLQLSLRYGVYLCHFGINIGMSCTDAQIGSYLITSKIDGYDDQYQGRVSVPYTPITPNLLNISFIYVCGSSDWSASGYAQAVSWMPQLYANGNFTVRSCQVRVYLVNNRFTTSTL